MKSIIKLTFFLFIVGLFFNRPNNIFIFYTTSITYIITSLLINFKHLLSTKQPYLVKRFLIFLLFSAASILWSVEPLLSIRMVIRLFLILILLSITYYNNKKYKLFKTLVYSLITGLFINLIVLILFKENAMDLPGRFSGTMTNANLLAIIIIFIVFFYSLYEQKEKKPSAILFTIVIGISLIIILATGSRKGLLLGSLITFISIRSFARRQKKYYLALLIFLPIISLYIIQTGYFNNLIAIERLKESISFFNTGVGDSSTKFRWSFIEIAYDIFNKNVAIGVGIDAFQHYTALGLYAHNNYLEILADLGLVGFVLYYSIYFPIIKESIKQRKNIIFVVMIFVVLIMEVASVNYYTRIFWIFMLFFYEQLTIQKKTI